MSSPECHISTLTFISTCIAEPEFPLALLDLIFPFLTGGCRKVDFWNEVVEREGFGKQVIYMDTDLPIPSTCWGTNDNNMSFSWILRSSYLILGCYGGEKKAHFQTERTLQLFNTCSLLGFIFSNIIPLSNLFSNFFS